MQLDEFLAIYAAYRDVKHSTIEQYRYVVVSYSRFLERPATMRDLEPLSVNRWLQWLSANGSKFTAKSKRMELITLWNLAAQLGHVEPPKMIRHVRTPEVAVDVLTDEQLASLRRAAHEATGEYNGYRKSDILRTLIQATLETAMRIGDLTSIEWDWMRSHRGRFELVERVQGKTSRRRRVCFSDALIDDIAKWHGTGGLTWPFGSKRTAQEWLANCGERAGVRVTWTKLRKTAITDVERQQPGTGWLFAGHSSPETTRKWYTDWSKIEVPKPRFPHEA